MLKRIARKDRKMSETSVNEKNPVNSTEDFSDLEGSMTESFVVTKKEHLPKHGPGPLFFGITFAVTVAAVIVGHINPISQGIASFKWLRYSYIGLGSIILLVALKFFIDAVVNAKIFENVENNQLVTTGVYAITRNPICFAIIALNTGILFISGNTYMYILPILYWLFITYLLKRTEEVWLLEKYGKKYLFYMDHVNRVIPNPWKKMPDVMPTFDNTDDKTDEEGNKKTSDNKNSSDNNGTADSEVTPAASESMTENLITGSDDSTDVLTGAKK